MGDFRICADTVVDAFVKRLGPPYHPNWATLVPGDNQKGWGAGVADWRRQAKGIITSFEACGKVHVDRSNKELDVLRAMPLSDFVEYLVEKAQHSAALVAARVAVSHLESVRHKQASEGLRARLALPMFKAIRLTAK